MRYIFNTSGNYVAFIQGSNLFSPNGNWIGFVFNGNEVYSAVDSSFIGYISSDDRIVKNRTEPAGLKPLRPLRPLRPLLPLRPLRRLQMYRLNYPWVDVFEEQT